MANVIEIILKASDQTQGVFLTQTRTIDKLKESFYALTGTTLSYAGGIALASLGVKKIVDFTKDAINETNAYNISIADQARVVGEDVEEMSRLVQVADDVLISQGKLKTALAAASRQGIDVSISGIQRLSDEYLSLTPGVARAEFVLKTFGHTGEDMGKLLELGGNGIRSAMDAVSDSLVVTEEAVKATMEYTQMVNDLDDAWKSFKTTIGNVVIPEITKTVNAIDFLLQSQGLYTGKIEEFTEASRAAGVSYEDYAIKVINSAVAMGKMTELAANSFIRQISAGRETEHVMNNLEQITGMMNRRMYEAGDASGFWTESLVGMRNEIPGTNKAVGDLGNAINSTATYFKALTQEILFKLAAEGLDSNQALALAESMGLVDSAARAEIEALQLLREEYTNTGDLEAYKKALAGISAQLSYINSMSGSIVMNTGGTSTIAGVDYSKGYYNSTGQWVATGGKAVGGYVAGGNSYLVGERGPEIFTPSGGGQITPNGQLGGGGMEIDYDRMTRSFIEALERSSLVR